MWFSMKNNIFPKKILDAIKNHDIKTLNTFIKNHPKKLDTEALALLLTEAGWKIYHTILLEDLKITEFMILHGSDIDICDTEHNHQAALHKAVYNRDIKSVKFLLEWGANPNVQDWEGSTPLGAASHIENLEILDILLQCGAKPDLLTHSGTFQTYDIFQKRGKDFIEKLLEYKVNLMSKDGDGWTPLHYMAPNHTSPSFIHLFEKLNLDVNIQNSNGMTPLHSAWYIEYVKFLLDKGADINIEDELGFTPLIAAIAFESCCQSKIKLLVLMHSINMTIPKINRQFIKRQLIDHHFVSGQSIEKMYMLEEMASFCEMCIQEIQCMKATKIIGNCKATYFSILADKELQFITYLRNKELTNHFYKINLELNFPIYAEMITNRFRKAADRLIMIQNAVKVLSKNIEQLNNNLPIIEIIVMFLSNHDLQLLM